MRGVHCCCWCLLLLIASCASAAAQDLPAQVADDTQCILDGFPDTEQYRSWVGVPGGLQFLPIFASIDLSQRLEVESVLVMVHGSGGKANTFFCDALKAAGGPSSSVGVVAPWFGNQTVRMSAWAGASVPKLAGMRSLHWKKGKWSSGGGAVKAATVASFDALDAVVAAIKAAHARHPARSRLKQIVVAGFNAGAQLVQRYAWATAYGLPGAPGPVVKFVVSDPATWLYLDDKRPVSSCRPKRDTGPSATCSTFVRPHDAIDCQGKFNKYNVGLQDLSNGSPYFKQARIADNPGALSAAYLKKDILYVFGANDTCNCRTRTYRNPAHCIRVLAVGAPGCSPSNKGPSCCDMPNGETKNTFTAGCSAMLQGSNRLQRGLLYMSHLRVFSKGQHTPRVTVVPNMGHDHVPMLNWPDFLQFVSPSS